jgi:cytochrome c556
MRSWIAGVALGAVICAGVAFAADTAMVNPQDAVNTRVATMKKLGGHLKAALDATAKSVDARAEIAGAIKIAESIPSLFPKGTGPGDTGVTRTRALQDIWAKPTEFKAAADALVAALKTTDAALAAGIKADIDAGFGGVRKSCGGCHTPFRGPEIP